MSTVSEAIQREWYRISLWQLLLIPLSGLFWLLSGCRRFMYRLGVLRSYRLSVPVIVVGNISVGGTGKTPLVIWLAQQLQRAGYRPAIISRGYGKQDKQTVVQVKASSTSLQAGDEPVLIAQRTGLPVWVGRDRVAVAEALLQVHPECDVLISDDGLQHYRLHRDVEVVVVDGKRQFGNGLLLPAGPLRESPSRLRQVDALVLNGGSKSHLKPRHHAIFNMQLRPEVFRNLLDSAATATSADFHGIQLHAVAGIGNPDRFFDTLRQMGLTFVAHAFPDHHAYQASDLDFGPEATVLMTEKDAVKCWEFADARFWQLPVEACIEPGLLQAILKKLGNDNGR